MKVLHAQSKKLMVAAAAKKPSKAIILAKGGTARDEHFSFLFFNLKIF